MPDTAVEFINNPAVTLAALQAGVSIVSNTATETAVVRDIAFTNPNSKKISLLVGSMDVLTSTITNKYSGTEIVGAGGSMVAKTPLKEYFNTMYSCNSTGSFWTYVAPTLFDGDSVQSSTQIPSQTAFGAALSVPPFYIFFDSSGNFYYQNHGSNTLFKRAGGINGTQSSVSVGGYGVCYDGVRYIYSFSDTLIYTYDTQNGTVSSVVYGQFDYTPNYSTSTAAAIDGRVFIKTAYNSGYVYWVNPQTGVTAPFNLGSTGYGAFTPICVCKDLSGNYVVSQFDVNNGWLLWVNLGTTISAPPSSQGSGGLIFPVNPNTVAGRGSMVRAAGTQNQHRAYIAGNSGGYLFDADKKTVQQIFSNSFGGYGIFVPVVDAAVAAQHFGQIGIRATGIKTT